MKYLVWALAVDNLLMDKHLVSLNFCWRGEKWASEPVLYPISSKVLSRSRCMTGCHYREGRRWVCASSNGWRAVLVAVYCCGLLRHIVSASLAVWELFQRCHNRWLIWKRPTKELEPSDVSFRVAKNKHEWASLVKKLRVSWTVPPAVQDQSQGYDWEPTQLRLWYCFLSMGASEMYMVLKLYI